MPTTVETRVLVIESIPERIAQYGSLNKAAIALHCHRDTISKFKDDEMMVNHFIIDGALFTRCRRRNS